MYINENDVEYIKLQDKLLTEKEKIEKRLIEINSNLEWVDDYLNNHIYNKEEYQSINNNMQIIKKYLDSK